MHASYYLRTCSNMLTYLISVYAICHLWRICLLKLFFLFPRFHSMASAYKVLCFAGKQVHWCWSELGREIQEFRWCSWHIVKFRFLICEKFLLVTHSVFQTQRFLTKLCNEVALRLQGCGVQGRSFTLKVNTCFPGIENSILNATVGQNATAISYLNKFLDIEVMIHALDATKSLF